MKKLLIALMVLFLVPFIVKADPPKKVTLSYSEGKLKIEALHPTKDSTSHYINQLDIKVDGKEVKVVKIDFQSSAKEEVYEIEIPEIKPGCEVEVKAHCNKFGAKSGSIKI